MNPFGGRTSAADAEAARPRAVASISAASENERVKVCFMGSIFARITGEYQANFS
jgi:hypothetical protein